MDMRKLLKKYIVSVFDDGSIEISEISEIREPSAIRRCENYGKDAPSSRISQALCTLRYIKEHYDDVYTWKKIFNDGIKYTAEQINVDPRSVHDKMCRQMDTKTEEWKEIIINWLENKKNSELEDLLKKHIVKGKEMEDLKAITVFFDNSSS